MDIDCVYSIAGNRLRCARVDFNIAPTNGFEYRSSVVGRLVERSVAVNCAYTK